jgi:hypothetical protein
MTHDKSTITTDGRTIRGTRCAYNINFVTYFELNAKEYDSIKKAVYKKLDSILIKKQIKDLHLILQNQDEKETLRLACLSEVV